jgi:hypothetical protein
VGYLAQGAVQAGLEVKIRELKHYTPPPADAPEAASPPEVRSDDGRCHQEGRSMFHHSVSPPTTRQT